MENQNCTLCKTQDLQVLKFTLVNGQAPVPYFHCNQCKLRFLHPELRLKPEAEKARYQQHDNNVSDPRYQNFVTPLCNEVRARYKPGARGLDFGAGEGPIISEVLKKDYTITQYDPFFWPNEAALKTKYDFVVACEVVEHFFNPQQEFKLLRSLLAPGGSLFLMTSLYQPNGDFENWFYRKDPTHVTLYAADTVHWIKKEYDFNHATILNDKIVIFS